MSAGTLTLTNGSAIVGGSGTSFATELAAGDFIVSTVGGVSYTLPVKSVASNAQLTLVSNFTGPTQAGAAWSAVPRVALNMVTAALVTQSAEALRGLNYDKQNWQQVFSVSGNITVKLPDGTTYSGPSWKYLSDNMATKTSGAVPVNQGGTGGTTKEDARTNLGLGSAATRSTYSASGDLLSVGDFGIGTESPPNPSASDANNALSTGVYYANGGSAVNYFSGYTALLTLSRLPTNKSQIQVNASGGIGARAYNGSWSAWVTHYNTLNTTRAADGTLKAASPIVKLFRDGSYETNAESEGVTVTRQGVGQYLIEGCKALNADAAWGGWDGGFDVPTDRNKQALIWLDYEVNPDGSVLVKTYHRTHPESPAFARNLIGKKNDAGDFVETVRNGDPIDIPADQFVSVRVEMPENSVWNTCQRIQQEAMDEEQVGIDNGESTQ